MSISDYKPYSNFKNIFLISIFFCLNIFLQLYSKVAFRLNVIAEKQCSILRATQQYSSANTVKIGKFLQLNDFAKDVSSVTLV